MPSRSLTETSGMPAAAPQRPSSLSPADEEALVRQHLPLVGYAVNDLARRLPGHVHREDLVSAGMSALAMAARSYQEDRGVPFGRYAARRIHGALLDELRSHDWASRSVRRRAREHGEAADALAASLGRPATAAELAGSLGVAVDQVEATERDVHRSVVLSFQVVADTPGADSLLPASGPTPDQVLLDRERDAYLRDAVATLPERLRTVVVGVFFDERPMQDIAADLGVTESRVSQMRSEALALLRDGMTASLSPERLVPEERPDGRVARRKEAYYAAIAARSDFRTRLSVPAPRPATSGSVAHSA
jgi:RNA polymerase sigma factor for flagellar operon FliA